MQETDNQQFTADESFDTPVEPQCETSAETDSLAEMTDKYVRLVAEFDNYRKRTNAEKLQLIEAGSVEVMRPLLEVLDDLDRAMEAIRSATDVEAVKEGIMLIDNKLRNILTSKGLTPIDAMGSELDTDLHEAVARVETPDAEQKGRIVDVVQKGYKLRDKVIRYAKVVVGQ